jgi:hypothetical protein
MKNYLMISLAFVCTICLTIITINTYQMGRYQLINVGEHTFYRVIDTKTGVVKSYLKGKGEIKEVFSTSHFNID